MSVSAKMPDLALALRDRDAERVMGAIRALVEIRQGKAAGLPTAMDAHLEFEAAIRGGDLSVMTGLAPLDEALGGLERQAVTILAGRPSMGKTALALQIARQVAKGRKVHFYSLEMSKRALWARAACPLVELTWRDVKAGRVNSATLDRLVEASRDLAESYQGRLAIDDRIQTTGTIWQGVAQERPDLVVVDHLRLLKDTWGDNEAKRQGRITEKFHEMAKALNVPIVVCAQLNRGLENRSEKTPTLSDLRDSGEIEEGADTVLMIHRPGYYEVMGDASHTEIWVRKDRNGVIRMIKLSFDGAAEEFGVWKETGRRTY
jgi:replicative DNA helicase